MATFFPSRWGILILNLGTPKSTSNPDVRQYLTEFLSDPFVIDIPWLPRQLLVRCLIAPFRAPKSAKLYKKIWTPQGSPLFVGTDAFVRELNKTFEALPQSNFQSPPIEWAFRYGEPNVDQALLQLKRHGCEKIVVLPLYPQYAESATLTSFEDLRRALRTTRFNAVKLIEHFHVEEFYLDSLKKTILAEISDIPQPNPEKPFDHIVYSFHSLPLRQVKRVCSRCGDRQIDEGGMAQHETLCYRGQCLRTARQLHDRLIRANATLAQAGHSISYQSRLGRTPWLAPQSEDKVAELAKRGVKRLLVLAPGFAVDCLETLEELDSQLKETFLKNGGEFFHRARCLNDQAPWVQNVHGHLSEFITQEVQSEKEEYLHAEAQRAAQTQPSN